MIIKNAIWCLIPARSGSKTLKNKNIRILGKYPLFIHSFITAKKIKKISRIYLSTDSVKYKNIANKYNFKDIHIRSKKIQDIILVKNKVSSIIFKTVKKQYA